ncbi:MAG TPA: penicillin-binding protein 2 [Ignavibacteria bacterium]|nr:penicillin-binding protein 2 [Bacteroidota bacterium]HRE10125.1 penicillin-binding protein 2 [Ignavibacteria bacterium]HRF67210.1 penicillin-binding protein 2 [Ignavibacteria bacterium]HRJ03135.1 penicillin-binding protein 2 [Ignavibacteria bacterium]HRJ86978.1 penicillin-binding protein 2 [Ignavibacteria bacterium]
MDLSKRKNFYYIFTLIIFIVIGGRLVQLQIINPDKFDKDAERNSVKTIITTPARGLIFDRNGKLLVDNKPSYSVTIVKKEFDTNNIQTVCGLLGIEPAYLRAELKKIEGTNRFIPTRIQRDVEFPVISFIEENRGLLKGVDYSIDPIRLYPTDFRGSHMIGYTKEISEGNLKKQQGDYYKQGDLIGTTGLEAGYENYLRGEKGFEFILQDNKGREVGPLNDGNNDVKAISGYDLILSVDANVQNYAEKLLEGRTGGIVAIDPTNGEIICMVSKPDYDLNHFSGKLKPEIWTALNTDKKNPLFNRATQTKYPPGSTYKMVSALAALQEGFLKPNSTIPCEGSFRYGNKVFGDHGAFGSITIPTAIEHSSNVFFYKLVLRIGIDNWSKYGQMLGFGQKTGIDIPEETKGLLPSTEYYNKRYGATGWTQGYVVSLGIGQGELGVSPLQMALHTAILSNSGTFVQPHLVRSLKNPVTGEITPVQYKKHEVAIDKDYFKIIQKGMYLVVNGNGTARSIRTSEVSIAGKTGTAQNPHGNDHSWFIAYAPADDPKIAICVLVENAGFGATVAAPIAQRIILKYLLGLTDESEVKDSFGER